MGDKKATHRRKCSCCDGEVPEDEAACCPMLLKHCKSRTQMCMGDITDNGGDDRLDSGKTSDVYEKIFLDASSAPLYSPFSKGKPTWVTAEVKKLVRSQALTKSFGKLAEHKWANVVFAEIGDGVINSSAAWGYLLFAFTNLANNVRGQDLLLVVKGPPPDRYQRSTINHQPSTINNQPSTINHQPSTINHQPSITTHPSPS